MKKFEKKTKRRRPENAGSDTLRPFPLPKEHGAWALLYGPFAIVALAFAEPGMKILLLSVSLTALFLAHEPLSRLARLKSAKSDTKKTSYWKRWLVLYASIAASAGVSLLTVYRLWALLPMGLAIGMLLLYHIRLISRRQERSVSGEVLGVVGLTSSVPVVYYALFGHINPEAMFLWLLNILYFSSAIFYVKMKVSQHVASRQQEARHRSWQCGLYHSLLLLTVLLLSWLESVPEWTILAFLPIVLRAFWGIARRESKLNLKKIGYTEVAHTLYFVFAMVVFYH